MQKRKHERKRKDFKRDTHWETSRWLPESSDLHGKWLLSVSGEPEDAFKSRLFSSDALQNPDFLSCLKGKSG